MCRRSQPPVRRGRAQTVVPLTGPLPARTPRTLTSKTAIMRELTVVPERGWAIEREEGNIGVSCVAAPIFGPLGDVVAALSVTGPSQLVRADRIGPAVRMASAAASRAYASRPRPLLSPGWAAPRAARSTADERPGTPDMRSR